MASTNRNNATRYFIGAILGVFLAAGSARADDLPQAQERYERAAADLDAKEREIVRETETLAALSAEIRQLKKSKTPGILQKYKLQSRLQQAQSLSEKLLAFQGQRHELRGALDAGRSAYGAALDRAIEASRAVVLAKDQPLARRQEAAASVTARMAERLAIILAAYERGRDNPAVLPVPAQGQEALREQADAMDDLDRTLSRELDLLQKELIAARRQKALNRELAQLFDEESFFAEQSFISLGATRSAARDAGAVALKAGDGAPAPSEPGAATQGPALPATGLPAGTVEADAAGTGTASVPVKDFDTRIAQQEADRSKWLQAKQKAGKDSVETSHLDRQIFWLEDQLAHVRGFLADVRQTRKEVQGLIQRP